MKKKCTILAALLLFFQMALPAQWRPANGPFGGAVWDLKSNALFVFATQSNGIYRAPAAGGAWERCDTARVHHLTVQDAVVLALSYEHHYLRYSKDHGDHWTSVLLPDSLRFARDWAVKNDVWVVSANGKLWRSTDNGNSWATQQLAGEPAHAYDAVEVIGDWFYLANQSRLFRAADGYAWAPLAPLPGVSPFESIFQLYGQNNWILAFTGQNLYYSNNSGTSFQTANTPPGSLGPLPPNFAVLGKYCYAASGKLLVSPDEGASWSVAPGHNEASTDLWAVAANDTALLCGSQTVGVYQTNGVGQHFYPANKGLFGVAVSEVALHRDTLWAWDAQGVSRSVWPALAWDTLHLYQTQTLGHTFDALFVFQNVLFAKQAGGTLQRSTDAGKTWQPLVLPGWIEQGQPFKFEAKGDTLFLAAPPNALWQSVDAGTHWTDAAEVILGQNGLSVEAFALQNGAVFLLSGSTIYRSVDQMKTWAAMGDSPGQNARLLATPSRLFALLPGDTPQLFVSSDEGRSWMLSDLMWPPSFHGRLEQRVSIFQHAQVLVGAFEQGGVFWAGLDGLHWQGFGEGLPEPPKIRDLAIGSQILAVGTAEGLFWRTLSDLSALSTGASHHLVQVRVSPNPGTGMFFIAMDGQEAAHLELFDSLGKMVLQRRMNGTTVVDLSAFSNGIYVATIQVGGQSGSKILVKQE